MPYSDATIMVGNNMVLHTVANKLIAAPGGFMYEALKQKKWEPIELPSVDEDGMWSMVRDHTQEKGHNWEKTNEKPDKKSTPSARNNRSKH